MSIWNRVQYPERHHVKHVFLNTSALVVAIGLVSLSITLSVTAITKILVG